MSERTVQVSSLGDGHFSVHLLAEDSAEDVPLAGTIDINGVRSNAALLRSSSGSTLARLVLLTPADFTSSPLVGHREAVTNQAEDELWDRRLRDFAALAGASELFPALVLPTPEGDVEDFRLASALYCPFVQQLFPAPCPVCLAPLRACRDDQTLAAAGLPLYSTSRQRFFFCPMCVEDGTTFYFLGDRTESDSGDGLASLAELRERLAATLDELTPGSLRQLPCAGCRAAPDCLGTAPVEDDGGAEQDPLELPDGEPPFWRSSDLGGAPFLLLRSASVSFDDLVAELGGKRSDGERTGGYLFSMTGSGIDAIEVLALKLLLFQQIVERVAEYHKRLQRPHLDLHPGSLRAERAEGLGRLPHLWSFRVQLFPSTSPLIFTSPAGRVFQPPAEPQAPFSSPAVRTHAASHPRHGTLEMGSVTVASGELPCQLEDPSGVYPGAREGSLIVLEWDKGPLADRGAVVSTATVPSVGGSSGVSLLVPPIDEECLAWLEGQPSRRLPVTYRVLPDLSVLDDIYSLGILLLRILLVNDRQDLAALNPLLEALPHWLGNAGPSDESIPSASSSDLAMQRHSELTAKTHVFWEAHDRSDERPNSIPDAVWDQVLKLAASLVARGPGFGLGGEKPYDSHRPFRHLIEIQTELDSPIRQLLGVLFERQTANVEIHTEIASFLAEIEASASQEQTP